MTFGTAFAVYFLFWWLSLFVILPFGAQSQAEVGEVQSGTEPGAPAKLRIWRKLFINTVFSAILFGMYWLITTSLGISLADLPAMMGFGD